MKRVVWLSDIHLNFLTAPQAVEFFHAISREEPDAILVGGDIAESPSVVFHLGGMARQLQRPVYFVLGNHDFYHGSIASTRRAVDRLCRRVPLLFHLPEEGVAELTARVGLIGHGGYADGRFGDYARSDVMLNDYVLIEEFAGLEPEARLVVMQELAEEAAGHVRRVLPLAFEKYEEVFFLTHVPPFREAAWYRGRRSDDDWAPHFSCKAVGDAILDCAKDRPDRRLTILCGHTHGAGQAEILPNVEAITGSAKYGVPSVNKVFSLD